MTKPITFKFVDLAYQIDAVNSTVDLFKGQDRRIGDTIYQTNALGGREVFANPRFGIPYSRIAENLKDIQTKNDHLLPDDGLDPGYNFTIDMETGTGKTYVYLRTILAITSPLFKPRSYAKPFVFKEEI